MYMETDMNDLIDKLIIFIACLALYAVDAGYGISVVPVIVALTLSALNSYFGKKALRLVFVGGYFLVCQFQPQFLVFLPLT